MILFVFLVVTSCNKKDETVEVKTVGVETVAEFNMILNLKNFDVSEDKKNDSISVLMAENSTYKSFGQKNMKSNYRVGWWSFYKNDIKIIDVEFGSYKGKEHRNQIIFYSNGKLDTLKSKFYVKSNSYDQNGHMTSQNFTFYTPHMAAEKSKTLFDYAYYTREAIVKEGAIRDTLALDKNNKYKYVLDLGDVKKTPQKKTYFSGVFSEVTIDKEITEVGTNFMFVDDSLVSVHRRVQ